MAPLWKQRTIGHQPCSESFSATKPLLAAGPWKRSKSQVPLSPIVVGEPARLGKFGPRPTWYGPYPPACIVGLPPLLMAVNVGS